MEIHHKLLKVAGGTDDFNNLIVLCRTCHKYAPNNVEEFQEYMDTEMNGRDSLLMKALKIASRGLTDK